MTDGVWVAEVLILCRFHSRGFFIQTTASGVRGTRTGWRLVASFSFCGWLKQKYKEKCSCLAAWRETVRSNKARAMDVNVFENTLVLTTCRSLRWWLLVSETVLKYQHNPTKLQRGIVLKGCIYFKIRKSLDEDCECKSSSCNLEDDKQILS